MPEHVERKIPVNILTGFLGSGKTTLLKRLLSENQGRRKIAILMNEIGEISIDAKLIEGFSVEIFELNDGCICCTINENFVQVLDEVSTKLSPDLLVIETTGVADPLSIIYSLINPNVVLDAVITTVDTKNFLRVKDDVQVWHEQIEAADVVLLTKTDLASTSDIEQVKNEIRACNTHCQVFDASAVALDLVFGVAYPRKPLDTETEELEHKHAHLAHDHIETFRLKGHEMFNLTTLQDALANLPPTLWRLKGLIRLEEQPQTFILNYAFGRYTIEDCISHAEGYDLVFIGKGILTQKEQLMAHLRQALAHIDKT
jgi:G3E family GTPase